MRILDTSNPGLARLAQQQLAAGGWYGGRIDGFFGPMSLAAFDLFEQLGRYADAARLNLTPTPAQQADLDILRNAWRTGLALYDEIAQKADCPPELVAALHLREGSCDFSTYLHNGDKLGVPTVNDPRGILFDHSPQGFIAAGVDAIVRETAARKASGITHSTFDLARLCTFAEFFNGLGYRNRGVPSPYILAGTSGYRSGKFVADGLYAPAVVDEQAGILLALRTLGLTGDPAQIWP